MNLPPVSQPEALSSPKVPFWRDLRTRRPGLSKIVNSTIWLLADRVLRMGVGLVVGVWVMRYLGAADSGLLNYSISLVALIAAVGKLGLERVVVRNLVRDPASAGEILATATVLKILGSVSTMTLSMAAITVMSPHDSRGRMLVFIIAAAGVVEALETFEYHFQALVAVRYLWSRNIAFLLMSAVRVALILSKAPVVAFAWTYFGEAVLSAAATILFYFSSGNSCRYWKPAIKQAKLLLGDSWPQMLTVLSVTIYMRIDQVMLRQMLGEREVGIYAAATRLSEVWFFIPMGLMISVFPSIVAVREHNRELYYYRLLCLFSLMSGAALLLSIPIAALSKQIVLLLFKAPFADAAPILAVHIWSSVFVFLGTAQEAWNLAEGLVRLSFIRTVTGALMNVLLNLVLIPKYGGVGAAWATLISYSWAAFFSNLTSAKTRPIFALQLKSLAFPWFLMRGRGAWGMAQSASRRL
jgi:PST family polysaccharide transporter